MRDPTVAIEREWPETAFAVCIIDKFEVCFVTKLCGKGSGEKSGNCERKNLNVFVACLVVLVHY